MSDLLGRMIARARAPLSPVQPILASLYEPANGPGPEPVTPWPDHEIEREEPSSQEARPLVSPVTSQPGEIQASGPSLVDQPIGRRDPEPRDPEPRMPEPRQPDRTIERHESGLRIPEPRQVEATRDERPISTLEKESGWDRMPLRSPIFEPPATGRPVTAPVRPATAPTRPVIAPTRPATASTRPEMADQEPEGPSQATVAAGASRSEHSRQAPRPISIPATREWKTEAGVDSGSLETGISPAWVETRRPAPRESARREREDPAPDSHLEVNIAIGHIEVRSVPKVEAPRRPAAKPRVTLDEYLRRRNGDSR